MKKFYRLSETINKKQDKRVVSVTIKPLLTDMAGTIWLTDLMLQEGDRVTGFYPHTEIMLQKKVKAAWLRSLSGITASSEDRKP